MKRVLVPLNQEELETWAGRPFLHVTLREAVGLAHELLRAVRRAKREEKRDGREGREAGGAAGAAA